MLYKFINISSAVTIQHFLELSSEHQSDFPLPEEQNRGTDVVKMMVLVESHKLTFLQLAVAAGSCFAVPRKS